MSSYTLPASPLGRSPWGHRDTDPFRRSHMVSPSYGSLGGPRAQPRSPLASSHQPARHVSGPAHYSPRPWPSQESVLGASPPWANTVETAGRRRCSVHSFTSAGQTSNFGSLVGSFQESLLRGSMSMPASKPLTFEAELGVLGLGRCRPSVRCPSHINLTFPAHFYNLVSTAASSPRADLDGLGSPYVGTIDLDGFYHDQLLSHQMSRLGLETRNTEMPELPLFPGYEVPPKGRLQLVVKYPNMNAVKLFLVPYDLTDMPAGSKTFVRQKSVLVHASSDDSECTVDKSPQQQHRATAKETLRFAIHLQFCSPASVSKRSQHDQASFKASPPSNKAKKVVPPHIYLHKSIRVVFAARALESSDNLVESIETPGQGMDRFTTYAGPDEDWNAMLKAAKTRLAAEHDLPQIDTGAGIDIPAPSAVTNRSELPSNAEFHGLLSPLNSDPNGERWVQYGPELSLSQDEIPHQASIPHSAKQDNALSMLPGMSLNGDRGREHSSTNSRASISTWQSLRKSWWGQSEQQGSAEPGTSDAPVNRPRRAWSFQTQSEALAPEHRASSPVTRIRSGSKAEALVQPIFAHADFDDHLNDSAASHRSQPGLLRKLSEQVARSHSPNSVRTSQVSRTAQYLEDEDISALKVPAHKQAEDDYHLR